MGIIPQHKSCQIHNPLISLNLSFWHVECICNFQSADTRKVTQTVKCLSLDRGSGPVYPSRGTLFPYHRGTVMSTPNVRFVTKTLAEQRAAFTRSVTPKGERKVPQYNRLWNSTKVGLLELVDVVGDKLIAVTIDVSQNADNKNIYVSLHHKAVVDTHGNYVDNHRSKRLREFEVVNGLRLVRDFMDNVGTPEDDRMGFYADTGITEDIRPAVETK